MPGMDWSKQDGDGPGAYQSFLVPAMFEPFAASLVVRAGIGPGDRVLDVACGTGALTRAAARAAGVDGAVVGVDLGEPTLTVARTVDAGEGAAPIRYVQSDAAELPVDSDAFDAALCQQGLQFFPDRSGALIEMHRALRPGGRVAVAVWTRPEDQPFGAVVDALERHVSQDAADAMRSPFAMDDQAELAGLLTAAGFEDVGVVAETIECTFATHTEFAPMTLAAGPVAPMFAEAPMQARRAVALEVAEALAAFALPDGRMRAPMTANVATGRRP
jgi:ubiquinone/menaquinone biosynthesis C-methylase UbiE